MSKKAIISAKAPKAVGPYSHACEANNFVYVSGMLGLDPATGVLATGVEDQAKRALDTIRAVLADIGLGMSDIVKTTIFLTDMKNFAAVNAVYARFFEGDFPARCCFAVVALPLGGLVEIEAIAAR
jgi:2-iminobutanoate/2-iminopropanoate deaminase